MHRHFEQHPSCVDQVKCLHIGSCTRLQGLHLLLDQMLLQRLGKSGFGVRGVGLRQQAISTLRKFRYSDPNQQEYVMMPALKTLPGLVGVYLYRPPLAASCAGRGGSSRC